MTELKISDQMPEGQDFMPPEKGNISVVEEVTVTEAAGLDTSLENGHNNCTNGHSNGIVEEPEETDNDTSSKIDSSPMQITIEEVPTTPSDDSLEQGTGIVEKADSSEDEIPLSQLKTEKLQPVHVTPAPHPYSHIRGRPALRGGSPFATRSEPTSPSNFGFPLLRKADGHLSLLQGSERKRPREDGPSSGSTVAAKRPRMWSFTNWWNNDEEQQQQQQQQNRSICAIM